MIHIPQEILQKVVFNELFVATLSIILVVVILILLGKDLCKTIERTEEEAEGE